MGLFGSKTKKKPSETSHSPANSPENKASARENKANDKTKTKSHKNKISNWYADRYLSIAVQRNVLFLFSILASVGVLVGLMLVKVMYDQRSIDPYLIEVEPDTGIAVIVDYKTKKEYTAQEALKESLLVNYIMARESYKETEVEKLSDSVRVFSSKTIYDIFVKEFKENIKPIQQYGHNASATIKIRSLNYIAPTRVNLRFSKIVSAENRSETREYKYIAIINFIFSDLVLNKEDLWLNPFGFQVTSYISQLEAIDD